VKRVNVFRSLLGNANKRSDSVTPVDASQPQKKLEPKKKKKSSIFRKVARLGKISEEAAESKELMNPDEAKNTTETTTNNQGQDTEISSSSLQDKGESSSEDESLHLQHKTNEKEE